MNYKALYGLLVKNPPKGWRLINYCQGVQGGVYLWPRTIPEIDEPEDPRSRINGNAILFEFHVTETGYARFLARAHFNGKSPTHDVRWLTWHTLAVLHCLATEPKGRSSKLTKSVALWDGGKLRQIGFRTNEKDAARSIRSYLKNPPNSLLCFIGHLGPFGRRTENNGK